MKPERAQRIAQTAGFPLALFALNLYVAGKLFSIEYSQFMGSIEGAYIGLSRYMMENWRDLTWFPLWYGGIPFQNTYPPLLHALVAGFASLARVSPARAHHEVTAVLYCLGPVSVYFLALRLTRSRWSSFWPALIYSVLSPAAFLMPLVHQDLGTLWTARRLQVLVAYGEGPHIAALAFLPVAVLALDWVLAERRPVAYIAAALGMDAVVLTNWLGSFALALAVTAYLVAISWNRDGVNWRERWLRTGAVALLAYALACPWIPPSTIADIRYNAQYVGGLFQSTYSQAGLHFAIVAAAICLAKLFLRRAKISPVLQFFLLFTLLSAGTTLSAAWFGVSLVPQPARYHLEMEMAICLAAAGAAKLPFDRLARGLRVAAASLVLLICGLLARVDRNHAGSYIKPLDIASTIEYQTARWLSTNLPQGRAMLPGSISLWLNAFSDVPQFGGGFDQGMVNRVQPAAGYQIGMAAGPKEQAASISVLWLKAFGVRALGAQGPNSREVYKPFHDSGRFRALLQEVRRDADDTVLLVPGISSLAHAIPAGAVVQRPPANGLDVQEVARYVAALDYPAAPAASLRWTSRHSVEVETNLRAADVLSFQETYDPGWHAIVNGTPRRISRDGLGQMIIHADYEGQCKIELFYDGGFEMKAARILSGASLAGCVIWLLVSRRRNPAA